MWKNQIVGLNQKQMVNMDLNEYKEKVESMEKKITKIDENIKILSTVFDNILDQFEKIKKDIEKNK